VISKISIFDYAIFDCDGVILNSNEIKTNAFVQALNDEPADLVETFIEYHKQNGGVSRYEKFRYFYEVLKKSKCVEIEIKRALDTYSQIVTEAMLECAYIPGVIKFISILKDYGLKIYVVSGSDQEELIKIFRLRGILKQFEIVLGSPVDKMDNVSKVKKIVGNKFKGIFFGDSKLDYLAAKKYSMDFIFLKGYSDWDLSDSINNYNFTFVADDFNELKNLL